MQTNEPVFVPRIKFCDNRDQGCEFEYNESKPNLYKNHRSKVHVTTARVKYSNPDEEVTITRTDTFFHCQRCAFLSAYPSSIQVSFYFVVKKLFN